MFTCFTKFYGKDKEDSILYNNLKSKYSPEEAEMIYENIIHTSREDVNNNFKDWFYKNNSTEEGGLENLDQNGEPLIEQFYSWLKFKNNYNRVKKVFSTNDFETSPSEFIDIAEGFSYYLIDTAFVDKRLTPDELIEIDGKDVRNIMNNSFKKFINKMEKNINDSSSVLGTENELMDEEELERYTLLKNEIEQNRELFYKSVNNYLRNKINLNINVETILSDDIETKEDKITRDTAFNKNSFEFDTKDGAPSGVKMLISTLPKVTKTGELVLNDMGLPKLVDYNKTFNFLQQKLIDVDNDIDSIINELNRLSKIRPELKELIRKLNFGENVYNLSSNPLKLIAETQLRTQFVNQFNKFKATFRLHIVDSDGKIKIINANHDTIESKIVNEWRSDFETKLSINPRFAKWASEVKSDSEKTKSFILSTLGISIPNKDKIPDELINQLLNYGFKTEEDLRNIFVNQKNTLKNIAKYAIVDDVVDFQLTNAENKIIYAITLNSFLSTTVNKMRINAGNSQALKSEFPELFKSAYSKDSRILSEIVKGKKLQLGIFDGFKSEENVNTGTPSKQLREKDLILQRILGIINHGYYPFIRTADRGLEYYLHLEGDNKPLISGLDQAKEYYKNHLIAEIETSKIKDTNVKFFDENNKNLRVFEYVDEKGKSQKLTDKISLEDLQSIDNPQYNPIVTSFINNMISNIIRIETEFIEKNGISEMELLKIVGNEDNTIKSKEELLSTYALNYHIGSIEQTKLFTGDLAFYKSPADVFKRMSMMNSTKSSLRTDTEILYVLNEMEHKQEKGSAGEITNRIKTVTFEDELSNLTSDFSKQEIDTFKKVFGKDSDVLDLYSEINEADGFAFITMDAYRRMRVRAGTWNKEDEKLYNDLASGNYSYNADNLHRFTMLKYQYTGKLFNDDLLEKNLNVPAGRKFAIMPLIPGLVSPDSTLGKINEQMIKNGVEMGFFTSTAKFGYTEFNQDGKMAAHQIYKDGKFNTDLNLGKNHDILDWQYMGDQLKINNKPKNEIQGTQRNKIIFSNFYRNGEHITEDNNLKGLLNDYQDLQKIKASEAMKILANDLGFKPDGKLDLSDLNNFIDTIVSQGLKQGYASNDIASILNLLELPYFESLPNKSRLESLLTSTLQKRAIKNSRRGDMLAQASDLGFEITDSIAQRADKHNLKFYRYAQNEKGDFILDENGKEIMLPMEIMVPLPNDIIQYVIDNYSKTNELTQEALDGFNKDIEKSNQEYINQLDKAYQEDLNSDENNKKKQFNRVEKFKTKFEHLTTYSGFRIPTQDMASLDVAKVKKFFMPHMTGMVVVPKAIVVKTGSDFDIDKMNFYMPNVKPIIKDGYKLTKDYLVNSKYRVSDLKNMIFKEYGKNFEGDVYQNFHDLIITIPTSKITNEATVALINSYKNYLKGLSNNKLYIDFTVPTGQGKLIEDLNKTELENKMLSTENQIILHSDNHKKLLSPLTEGTIKNLAKEINKLRGIETKESFSDVFYGKTNIEKFIAFLAGKAGVGQVAVHITNHALAQVADLKMKSKHNYFIKDELIDLSQTENQEGQNISEILSELITAYVDIAKDPYILDLNAISDTANTMLMMVRWGIPVDEIFYFLNQPIIRSYLKNKNVATSVSSVKGFGKKSRNEYISQTLKDYNIYKSVEDMIFFKEEKLQNGENVSSVPEGIYENINKKDLKSNLSKRNSNYQYQMLDLFLEYQRQSKMFQDMIRSSSPDTQSFKNVSILDAQLKLKDTVEGYDMFENYRSLFDKTFIGQLQYNKQDYFDAIRDLFVTQHPNLKDQFDNLKNLYMKLASSPEESNRITNKIDNEFINFLLPHSELGFNFEEFFETLFKSKNSLPKQVMKIKNFMKKEGIGSLLFDNLESLVNLRDQGFDSLKLSERKIDESKKELLIEDLKNYDSQEVTEELEKELGITFPNNLNFAETLWVFSMMQSSMNNHPLSLKDLFSADLHLRMVKKIFNNFAEGTNVARNLTTEYTGFAGNSLETLGEFILNNPNSMLNRKIDGLEVTWNRIKKKIKIKHVETKVSKLAQGNSNLVEYHGIGIGGVTGEVDNKVVASKIDLSDKNNPLRKACNIKK